MIQLHVDICMTATIRPIVLEETLKSFTEKMLKDKSQYRLILNIDPIGEKLKRIGFMKEIARKYFDDVILNMPEIPGFTKAVQWCWSQTTSDFVFHLEDDWRLTQVIDIDDMINIMKTYNLTSLRLSKDDVGKSKHSNQYGFIYYPKISLNPTIFNGNFLREVSPLMNLLQNPEKQLRPTQSDLGKIIVNTKHGIYTKPTTKATVHDIGRAWMNKTRFKKKTGFLNWELKS